LVMAKMIRSATPPNKRVNPAVRPVTRLACARPAPARPVAYGRR
jgi:hypothetical protein